MRFREVKRLSWADESLVRQISKVHWHNKIDHNFRYFFKCVNGRRNRNFIREVCLKDGFFTYDKGKVKKTFFNYFRKVFSKDEDCAIMEVEIKKVVKLRIPLEDADLLARKIMEEEIKKVIFSMDNNKAPGLDRYDANFFKKA